MPKYRSKPETVDAFRLVVDVTPSWFMKRVNNRDDKNRPYLIMDDDEKIARARIYTIVGWMTCHIGDWIVRDADGHLSVCFKEFFEEKYEEVND